MKNEEVNVSLDGQTTDFKLTSDGITAPGFMLPSDGDHVNSITQTDDIFNFNNDASFTWIDQNQQEQSIKISDLARGDETELKKLLNRVITLERANAFQRSNLTNNTTIYTGDAASGYTDTRIYDTYYNVSDPQNHVNPEA